MRAFVSVDVEDSQIVQRIQEVQSQITEPGVRFAKPSIIHLTLKFLGEIAPEKVHQLETALTQTASRFPPFEISFVGFGVFPKLSRPRVIWIGVEKEGSEDQLKALAAAVDRSLQSIGFPSEKRPFSSHLTIGRVKFAKSGLRKQLQSLTQELAMTKLGKMVVEEVRLKKSTLTPKGPIYETLVAAPLTSTGTT